MTVHKLTELVYEELEPFTRFEDQQNFALLNFLEASLGNFLGDLYDLVSDSDTHVGWQILFDPDAAPIEGLPYLAQFLGAVLTPDMDESTRREEIKEPSGWQRGGIESLVSAVKRTLIGSQTVVLQERHEGNAWRIWLRTLASETPDPQLTEEVLYSQKVIGIVPLYESVNSISWYDLVEDYDTWDDVMAEFDSWEEVLLETPS